MQNITLLNGRLNMHRVIESDIPKETMTLLFYAMGGQALRMDKDIIDNYNASDMFEKWYNRHPKYKNMNFVSIIQF
jgi:hypothetical protein